MKPIETEYNGVIYRSRLEARWAVFFDEIGLEHFFEKEGFKLDTGYDGIKRVCEYYLPDFWLPGLECWLEIKPVEPAAGSPECTKCAKLATVTDRNVYLVHDDFDTLEPKPDIMIFRPDGFISYKYMFCACPHLKQVGFAPYGKSDEICVPVCKSAPIDEGSEDYIVNARIHARNYRFWK